MASTSRVILHIDMDCFYAQVEALRLGIPPEVPLAVQQWEGLIAINYPARSAGINRHMRVHQAKQLCPELRCVHVETLGGASPPEAAEEADAQEGATDRLQQKACLERYRRASAEIFRLVLKTVPQAVVEKASIDEVYVDITLLVEAELRERAGARGQGPEAAGPSATQPSSVGVVDAFAWGSCVVGGPLDPGSEFERRLSVGAGIACRLRGAIKAELGFTASAGVAGNKLVAKVASAMNKPNRQTVVPPRAVPELMETLPLKKLRNFGGKLGAQLEALGASTAGQVAALDAKLLGQHFGRERAAWIAQAVRGHSDEPVTVRELSKSMLAAKSFEATSDPADVTRWLRILSEELADRLTTDQLTNERRPRTFSLGYSSLTSGGGGRSKSQQAPARWPQAGPSTELLVEQATQLFKKITDPYPIIRLAFSAHDFVPLPLSEGQGAITRFFSSSGTAARPPGPGGGQDPPAGGPPTEPAPARASTAGPTQPTIRGMLQRQSEAAQAPAERAQPGRGEVREPGSGRSPAGAAASEGDEPQEAPCPGMDGPPRQGDTAGQQELQGVDVEEQRRIMRDIWVQQQLRQPKARSGEADTARKRQLDDGGRQQQGKRGPSSGPRQTKLTFSMGLHHAGVDSFNCKIALPSPHANTIAFNIAHPRHSQVQVAAAWTEVEKTYMLPGSSP